MPVGNPTFGNSANLQSSQVSQTDAAKLLNVSPRTVASAHKVLTNPKTQPEIIAAVEQGVMKVSVAAGIATKPRERQLGRLARDQRKLDGTHRQEEDFYRTPPHCTEALLKVEEFPAHIWEPACGDGAISKVLLDAGYDVTSTDLIDRGYGEGGIDFLDSRKLAGCVITNPPYELADEFAIHALKIGVRKMALLCRLAWLEGVERHDELFTQRKLARVWVFSARQTLWHGEDDLAETTGGMTAFAWFVFDRDHNGPWTGDWLTVE